MDKTQVTSEEIKRAVIERIAVGSYEPGKPIPSIRDLARELGANRNTVNKAYRALAVAGLLQASAGRQGFIVSHTSPLPGIGKEFRQQMYAMIWRGMASGLPREQVLNDAMEAILDVYGTVQHDVRLAFVECNLTDAEGLSAKLSALLGLSFDPLLIDSVRPRVDAIVESYDILVTTFQHLAELMRIFPDAHHKIVGIETRLSQDTLLGIARLHAPRIGLVCAVEPTTCMVGNLIATYHPNAVLTTSLDDDIEALVQLAAHVDHLVVTHNCVERVVATIHRQPDVVVNFQVDEQSISFLRDRIHRVRRQKLAVFEPQSMYQPLS